MIYHYDYPDASATMPHWSVSVRCPGTNHAHMNRRTFDGIYGKGAYDDYYNDYYVSKEVDISTTGNMAEKDYGKQFYEKTGGIMIYTNQFLVFIPITTRP